MEEGKEGNKMKQIITGLSGFLILNLYFNTTTHFLTNSVLQFCCELLPSCCLYSCIIQNERTKNSKKRPLIGY